MGLFDKKPQQQPPQGVPMQNVLQMRGDGLSNNQIIQNLQRQGFDANQIFDAMSQADMQSSGQSFPDLVPSPQAAPPAPQQSFQDMSSLSQPDSSASDIEAIVESMIDQKWGVFEENVKKILTWKSDVETRISRIEQNMAALQQQMQTLQEGIFGRVGEYDKHILSITTELKAVDKVFQKVLPTLAENVAELGNIANTLKKK